MLGDEVDRVASRQSCPIVRAVRDFRSNTASMTVPLAAQEGEFVQVCRVLHGRAWWPPWHVH